jgi:hypothetical protein
MKSVVFIRQIRAQHADGKPYPYWINVTEHSTIEKAREGLKEYRETYGKTRDVKNNSRIMKVTNEVVV